MCSLDSSVGSLQRSADEVAQTSKLGRLDSLRAHRKGQETGGQDRLQQHPKLRSLKESPGKEQRKGVREYEWGGMYPH